MVWLTKFSCGFTDHDGRLGENERRKDTLSGLRAERTEASAGLQIAVEAAGDDVERIQAAMERAEAGDLKAALADALGPTWPPTPHEVGEVIRRNLCSREPADVGILSVNWGEDGPVVVGEDGISSREIRWQDFALRRRISYMIDEEWPASVPLQAISMFLGQMEGKDNDFLTLSWISLLPHRDIGRHAKLHASPHEGIHQFSRVVWQSLCDLDDGDETEDRPPDGQWFWAMLTCQRIETLGAEE